MDPTSQLARLRRRHGVSEIFARRFLPLVERATKASPDVRQRILEMIERSFVRQASRAEGESKIATHTRKAKTQAEADRAVLEKVARILHRW